MAKTGIKKALLRIATNIRGWHTDRKILVIESDDWGSIRMPHLKVYEELIRKGIPVQDNHYLRFDSLESEEDLEALFCCLRKFKDIYGNHPIINTYTIISNPDFDKILDSGFKEYFSEPFTETYLRYPGYGNPYKILKQGISERLILPQYHGKEHLNIFRWMDALKNGNYLADIAFRHKMFDLSTSIDSLTDGSFMDSLRYENDYQRISGLSGLHEGISLFKDIFGKSPDVFTPPRYTWDDSVEDQLSRSGIKYISTRAYQSIPYGSNPNSFKKRLVFTGGKSKYDIIYLTRNVWFEPSSSSEKDWVKESIKEIETAFMCHKPAIVCTHRVNFSGNIVPENRKKNLQLFEELITKVLLKFPDIEFVSSKDLGDLIKGAGN